MTSTPASWLIDHVHLLPPTGVALDLACGRGRHGLWLAEKGYAVTALDRDESAIRELRATASRRGLHVQADVVDLEDGSYKLPEGAFDVIVVVHYLHRRLFPTLLAALRPGGVLVYETFTRDQALRGKPTNPDFLLEPGELVARVTGLELLAAREGEFEGRMVASVVARRS